MYLWTAVLGTAIAAVGFLYTVIKLNNTRNSPYQTRSGAERRSSTAEESNIVLCETCNMPQMGDVATWKSVSSLTIDTETNHSKSATSPPNHAIAMGRKNWSIARSIDISGALWELPAMLVPPAPPPADAPPFVFGSPERGPV
uniref:Uncharacterized protein n=1 Tax=Anopheles culicifacies TaxID=139723 RepID=A0A182M836_9DIPT